MTEPVTICLLSRDIRNAVSGSKRIPSQAKRTVYTTVSVLTASQIQIFERFMKDASLSGHLGFWYGDNGYDYNFLIELHHIIHAN